MNYFKYLKNSFPLYITSSVLLGLAVLSLVTIHRYNNFLKESFDTINNIALKEEEIKREIDQTDELITYFQNTFGIQEDRINPEKLILHGLDEMKMHLNNALILVSKFEDVAGEKQLPVEIKIPINNYRAVIDHVSYVESFRLPYFRIKNLTLNKEESGGVVLGIQGSFLVPLAESII